MDCPIVLTNRRGSPYIEKHIYNKQDKTRYIQHSIPQKQTNKYLQHVYEKNDIF